MHDLPPVELSRCRAPRRWRRVATALAVGLVLVAGPTLAVGPTAGASVTTGTGDLALQDPTDTTIPGGIGEPPGGGSPPTTDDDSEDPATTGPATTVPEDDPPPPPEPDGSEESPAEAGSASGAQDGEDGPSAVALVMAAGAGLALGLLLAGVPALLALRRRRSPAPPPGGPAPAPPLPRGPGGALPTPPGVPSSGPVIGPAPARDEAVVRNQRAGLVEALMALRDQVPSEALAAEAGRALAAAGITEIRPEGEPFDPTRHRAVDRVATDDAARHDVVVAVERPGYADGSRTIRLPDVVVARHGGGA